MNVCWHTEIVVNDSIGADVTNGIDKVALVELIVIVPRSPPSSTGNIAVPVSLKADGCG